MSSESQNWSLKTNECRNDCGDSSVFGSPHVSSIASPTATEAGRRKPWVDDAASRRIRLDPSQKLRADVFRH